MKAVVAKEAGGLFFTEEVALDDPKEREVLVDVKASGLCHSDAHIANDGYGNMFPIVLGHEIAGVVKEVGKQVNEFKIGDHVVGCLIQFCGHCLNCLSGRTHLCINKFETQRAETDPPRIRSLKTNKAIYQGYGIGGFAEQALIHQNQLVKVPHEIPFTRACLLGCGTITGAGAVINTAQVKPQQTVVVIGIGGVGLNVISGARICGARHIIAIDLQSSKLEIAKKFGATHTINSGTEDMIARVKEITGSGADAVFEVTGLKTIAEQAIDMTCNGGGVFLIGLQKPGKKIEIDAISQLIRSGKRLQGVWMGSTNLKRDIPTYAELYLQGRLELDHLVSNEINIDQVQEAYNTLNKGGVIARSVITSF